MADAVIIDDGGSTRIKQLTPNSDMDGLIGAHSDLAHGRFETPVTPVNPKCTLTVVHIDATASPTKVTPVTLNTGDIVEIVSDNGQKTTVVFRVTRQLDITVGPDGAGQEPIVDARQGNDKRRYIVTNAGAIKSVTHVRGSTMTTVFAATTATIYTMVHFG